MRSLSSWVSVAFAVFMAVAVLACGSSGTEVAGGGDGGAVEDAGGGKADSGKPDSGTVTDAGGADAGAEDTGNADIGPADAGVTDAGGDDGAAGDAGQPDAGADDAGGGFDGGPESDDSGTFDGGPEAEDAGTVDVGAADGGTTDGGTADGGTADGGTTDAGTSDAGTVDAGTDAGPQGLFDLGPATGPLVRFDFNFDETAGAIFDSPYPNDYFTTAQGNIIVHGFPTPSNFIAGAFVNIYVNSSESRLKGFSTNTPAYFSMAGTEQIDTASLPATAAASLSFTTSSVLILDVDPASPDVGKLHPVEWHYSSGTTVYEPYGKLLAVAPIDGFPLRPSTTYAVILTSGVTADGTALGRTQQMADLYRGMPSTDVKLDAAYKPLADWLAANKATLDPERVRAATVFTTQDPVAEMKKMRDQVRAQYPNGIIAGSMTSCAFASAHTGYVCFNGKYGSPLFMSGTKPYESSGGNFTFDGSGNPIVISTESMDFAFCVPSDQTPPVGGWPVALISHGTGGDFDSYIGSGINDTSERLLGAKIATIGLNQPLHGARGNNYTTQQLEQYTFNVANPDSARSIIRQGALDNVALLAFLKAGKFVISKSTCTSWPAAGQYQGPDAVPLNTDSVVFGGHSQGGLAGAVLAGVEPDIKAYMLSGAGGRMQITIMERQQPNILDMLNAYPNPFPPPTTVTILAKTEAYKLHPLFMLVQQLVDVVDAINYAPLWVERPFDNGVRSVGATTGFLDTYTPKHGAFAMAVAGGVPLINPVAEAIPGLEMKGLTPLNRPATDTATGPGGAKGSCGLMQYPNDGHFAIFDNLDAAAMVTEFLRTAAYNGKGVLGY